MKCFQIPLSRAISMGKIKVIEDVKWRAITKVGFFSDVTLWTRRHFILVLSGPFWYLNYKFMNQCMVLFWVFNDVCYLTMSTIIIQTVKTLIREILQEPSDLDVHFLKTNRYCITNRSMQSNLDISKSVGLFFTSSNYPKCKIICTSGNYDL